MPTARSRRRDITEAALRVFARKGYRRAVVADVAAEAGVSKGTIYTYFSRKEHLLGAVFDRLAEDAAGALQVPESALFCDQDGWAVFVENDGRARRQRVVVGRRSGLRTQILDGLEEGDRVITHPATDLSEGMRVEAR
jgi:AcrR family transcriptional regulator